MKHLHVVTMITNPARFQSRIRLFRAFQDYMSQFKNVSLWVVEGIYPGCDYEVTDPDNPYHLRMELKDELWCKENLLNELVKQRLSVLCPNWEAVAWIDADVTFARPDWVEATLLALEAHPVVQLFSQCMDLTDRYETVPFGKDTGVMEGVVYRWVKANYRPTLGYNRLGGHYGYAWAMRRDAWDIAGGLIDIAITGSADHYMSYAFAKRPIYMVGPEYSRGYRRAVQAYCDRFQAVDGVAGYVKGMLFHHWHGHKAERGYVSRHDILKRHRFDPYTHLARQDNGALCWNREDASFPAGIVDDLRAYFRSRNEDASAYHE